MKQPTPCQQPPVLNKPALDRPVLKRLGTLKELTRHGAGGGNDGGFTGMSFV